MTEFTKVIRPGGLQTGGKPVDVFCKIEYKDGRLSFTGVVGPRASGNAYGGAGQIDMEFAHRNPADDDSRYSQPTRPDEITFAVGWDADRWLTFLDLWKEWHLNDMRPECEHQRALGWPALARQRVTIYHWQLTSEATGIRRVIKRNADEALLRGETVTLTEEQRRLIGMPLWLETATPEPPSPEYEPRREGAQEQKTLGWVRPSDHPDGLLTKPCPECGYRYGSEWKTKEVPDDVLEFLRALPDTDRTPAWV